MLCTKVFAFATKKARDTYWTQIIQKSKFRTQNRDRMSPERWSSYWNVIHPDSIVSLQNICSHFFPALSFFFLLQLKCWPVLYGRVQCCLVTSRLTNGQQKNSKLFRQPRSSLLVVTALKKKETSLFDTDNACFKYCCLEVCIVRVLKIFKMWWCIVYFQYYGCLALMKRLPWQKANCTIRRKISLYGKQSLDWLRLTVTKLRDF